MPLHSITDDFVADLEGLAFDPPVTHVYSPLVYARAPWDLYCDKYERGREVLMVGLNAGAPLGVPIADEGEAA